ncbi:unnamed protein product [Cyclocybe aegerita]|uniref:Alpha/beta hydrolase fold-3 domain-containing protein n=1 Tax=Cyclocybe aegerita TaxID=1973307 RepID=A0A8S0XHV3_CYCAE|nr:unnamed protein product [Cyclocybe aegerita]
MGEGAAEPSRTFKHRVTLTSKGTSFLDCADMGDAQPKRITIVYAQRVDPVGLTSLAFDAYLPTGTSAVDVSTNGEIVLPAVVYFHGGGLTVGNRDSWFPTWLQKRVLSLGFIFISADYELIPPSNGHNIAKNLQDLFCFLSRNAIKSEGRAFHVDTERITVSGSSAGGLCAYLAAIHCSPKPKAIVSMYGMGGDFLTPHYLRSKTEVFFRGRELLNPVDFAEYMHPFQLEKLPRIADSPLVYHPPSYHIPGYPANPRMLLARLYLQLGIFLDYYTARHEPSLSSTLRSLLGGDIDALRQAVPEECRSLFPQFCVDKGWPPTMLLHGTNDTAVSVEESRNLRSMLENLGVAVQLTEFEGKEHSFDYEPGAEDIWKDHFDNVNHFIGRFLKASS